MVSQSALAVVLCLLAAVEYVHTQPSQTDSLGEFKIVGNSLVSAQQVFLGTADKVYIVDKTENNPQQINGHPAWASEFSMAELKARPMDIVTNSFCAGGNVLGNGTWLNVGGNQAVQYGGDPAKSQTGGAPYDDGDGGKSIRLLNPCDDESCNWIIDNPMTTRRWYPTLETLEDGSMIILGGCDWGGYVNSAAQDNPTYEFYPSRGDPVASPILASTLPVNLYPLTYLLPSGNLLIQSNWKTVLLDYEKNKEYPLDDIPDAVRTYPASAGNVILPLTPMNNWTATILFCGGSNIQTDQWEKNWDIPHFPASDSCVTITPDVSGSYTEEDPLPEGRSMGNLIILPTGQLLCLNGAKLGTAGYGNTTFTIDQSYGDQPNLAPILFNPSAPAGQRWTRDGLSPSTIPRMYHSTATLLPDGSVFVAGSNPNSDFNDTATYPTEYRVEIFYPLYYNERRPQPQGLPSTFTYGGPYFNVSLSSDDLFGNVQNAENATVVILRTGFSTHAITMGHRMVELDSSYTGNSDGSAVLHVSQLPPNPAIMAPGPAFIFVVVNGVPSVGVQVMVGSGKIEKQKTLSIASLPSPSLPQQTAAGSPKGSSASLMRAVRWSVTECLTLAGTLLAVLL
ncbi:glyoxal oxidase [Piloderma croceum F 1598]|uniref:Glyoxal oxidase n=1 Tax=Piloderma croceum (strain F 1598) TaxID=765440 RepID=A0A0C3FYK7_PILCF|nr:glyoxal oxidase [Piloderma croceum F 1598]